MCHPFGVKGTYRRVHIQLGPLPRQVYNIETHTHTHTHSMTCHTLWRVNVDLYHVRWPVLCSHSDKTILERKEKTTKKKKKKEIKKLGQQCFDFKPTREVAVRARNSPNESEAHDFGDRLIVKVKLIEISSTIC